MTTKKRMHNENVILIHRELYLIVKKIEENLINLEIILSDVIRKKNVTFLTFENHNFFTGH